ncbi:aminopeptidase n, partial [Lasius niger]
TDIRNIMHGMLGEGIDYIEDSREHEFTKCLREEAAKWSCLLGHNMCREMAENAFEQDRSGDYK